MEDQRTWNIVVFSILAAACGGFLAVFILDFNINRVGLCAGIQDVEPWACGRAWISATNGIVGGVIGGGMTIGAAWLAWRGVQKQIAVSEVPHKREAAQLILQEMHCCNVVSSVSEIDLIDGFIKHLEDRAFCLENGVEPTPMLDDFHEAMKKYDNSTPKVAVLFGNAERRANLAAYRCIAAYLDDGLSLTYKFYRSGLRVDDPQKVRNYILRIISFEGGKIPAFKKQREILREKAVTAERHYSTLLQDLYDQNSV